MNLKSKEQENDLSKIIRLLSMYHALSLPQLQKLFPALSEEKLTMLLHRLEKSGRLVYTSDGNMILCSKDHSPDPAVTAAFWVLLDFQADVIYHTVSDFPVALTFYTNADAYDVIYVPEEKEILINHALSVYPQDAPRRIVNFSQPKQMSAIHFPSIAAFCTITEDGQVQYYKKQGAINDS